MRRYFVIAAFAMVAVLVGASTASAFISNPQTPGNWGTLTSCGDVGEVRVATGDQTFNPGDYLRLGWATNTRAQSENFLAAQSGTVTITGTNGTTGTQSWTWGVGDTDDWTLPVRQAAPGNTVNGGKPLWITFTFLQVTLPPGSYTVSADFQVNKPLNDGSPGSFGPGSWFSTSGCTLMIQ